MALQAPWLCSYVLGQEIPAVSYPTDLSSGYKIVRSAEKTAGCALEVQNSGFELTHVHTHSPPWLVEALQWP
jgi:hypothetical protein